MTCVPAKTVTNQPSFEADTESEDEPVPSTSKVAPVKKPLVRQKQVKSPAINLTTQFNNCKSIFEKANVLLKVVNKFDSNTCSAK